MSNVESLIGMVEMPNPAKRQKWLDRMSRYGERAG